MPQCEATEAASRKAAGGTKGNGKSALREIGSSLAPLDLAM